MQRRQAAPEADELGVVVLAVDAGDLRTLRAAPAAFAGASAAALQAAFGHEPLLLFFRERREILRLRRHRYVRVMRRQLADDLGTAVGGGEGERRLAFDVLFRVDA